MEMFKLPFFTGALQLLLQSLCNKNNNDVIYYIILLVVKLVLLIHYTTSSETCFINTLYY